MDDYIAEFQILEDQLNDALCTNDVNLISPLLAGSWIILEPQMGIVIRDRFLSAIESGDLSHEAMRKKIVDVKIFDSVAIVISRGFNKGIYNSIIFNSEQWVTNIYNKENEKWICVMTQEAPLVK